MAHDNSSPAFRLVCGPGNGSSPALSPWLLYPHRRDDWIGLAYGFGVALAVPNAPSRRFIVPNLTGPNALLEARSKFIHEVVSKLLIAAIGCISRPR